MVLLIVSLSEVCSRIILCPCHDVCTQNVMGSILDKAALCVLLAGPSTPRVGA